MADINNQKLFNEFPPVSAEEWRNKIIEDLKGADFDKKLTWRTIEGFDVNPYYLREDIERLPHLNCFPGEFPYTRGTKKDNDWCIRQDIDVKDIRGANKKALDILMKGVTSLGFILDNDKDFTEKDFAGLLEGIALNCIELNIAAGHRTPDVIAYLEKKAEIEKFDKNQINGSILFDPLKSLTLKGNFCKSADHSFEKAKNIIMRAGKFPNLRVIGVSGDIFNNSGASIVQELAFSLAAGEEYLSRLTEKGLSIDGIALKIKFTLAVSSNYFMEIAKLRAGRILWAKIVEAFNPKNIDVAKMNVHSVTSMWNQSVYDPYVNMLRTQTEAMSAAIGGTDSLTVEPFDKAFEQPTEFAERIARNQQILLKEESHFDKIADASAGSYYIEKLTDSIVKKAWELFLAVQDKGGYIASFTEGFIQREILSTSRKRDINIATRKENLLGINQFPNFNEKINGPIDEKVTQRMERAKPEDAIAEPLTPYRGAQAFEELRMKTDRCGKRPKVFMFTYGSVSMRRTRSQFSSNFFACAGFEVVDNNGFTTIDEGVKASLDNKADIVVVCSSDEEYAAIVPEIFEKLKNKAIIVVAGAPECMDDLKEKGINNFIHMKSNVLESLKLYQKELKIS